MQKYISAKNEQPKTSLVKSSSIKLQIYSYCVQFLIEWTLSYKFLLHVFLGTFKNIWPYERKLRNPCGESHFY